MPQFGALQQRTFQKIHSSRPYFCAWLAVQADLGDLRGLTTGLDGRNSSMVNGGDFDGAKAYKDSKVGGSSQVYKYKRV